MSHCINMDEFTIEGNCVSQLPDGLLSSLINLSSITLARNQFASFPLGGPTQFTSVHVNILLLIENKLFLYRTENYFFFLNSQLICNTIK